MMEISVWEGDSEHEQVLFCREPSVDYTGIIAIHSTALGPAVGGTRFWNYSSEEEALADVLRLSRGMTYKASVAGVNLGGGKAVIIGDPRTRQRELIFRVHGRFVESLKGRYITAEDVGTSVDAMEYVSMETQHVTGRGEISDPSPVTAWGTYVGIRAAAQFKFGSPDLEGKTISVQGVGYVGYHLCEHLAREGVNLIVTDIDEERVQRVVVKYGAEAVKPEAIYDVDADIYAPCALGATVNDDTIKRLKVQIIAGAANNVLAGERHGDLLEQKGILYAPDYVINAGGLINVYGDLNGWSQERSLRKASDIYYTLLQIFELAQEQGIPPRIAADRVAESRIERTVRVLGHRFSHASHKPRDIDTDVLSSGEVGAHAGGYIVFDIPEARKPFYHDLLKGFEDYARLKGYRVFFSVDNSVPNKAAYKFTMAESGNAVSPQMVRHDVQEYVTQIQNMQAGDAFIDLPIVTTPLEHHLVVAAIKNRFSFLQHSYNLEKNARELYQRLLEQFASQPSKLLPPSVVVHTGGAMDARTYSAVNSNHLLQGDNSSDVGFSSGTSIHIDRSFNAASANLEIIEQLIQALLTEPQLDPEQRAKAVANLTNVQEELREQEKPDGGRIRRWLENAKLALETGNVGAEAIEKFHQVWRAFNLTGVIGMIL
jgi:leucine dehydrogenase